MTGDHPYTEFELEPQDLIRRSNLVLRVGHLMLGAGTSSLRVQQSMQRVARALGLDRLQAQITFTNIVATVHRGPIFRTQAGVVTTPGVNADRIKEIQRFSRELHPSMSADDIAQRLDAIERRAPLHPSWLVTLAVGLACASVGFLNQTGGRDLLAVLLAGCASFMVHRRLLARRLNLFGAVAISTMVADVVYLALLLGLHGGRLGSVPHIAAGFMAVSIFLVPGFPLLTGSLDIARLDLQAGMGRIVYAGVVMLSMGIGSWSIATVVGLQPSDSPPLDLPSAALWTMRVAASFLAVFGWAIMFNSPLRESVASAIIGIVGGVVRLGLLDAGVVAHLATFIGALVIGLTIHLVSRRLKLTRLIMLVPTLLVMIPGAPALRALLYFNSGDLMGALQNGITVVLQVLAMVCGLVASMMLLDRAWAFTRSER